MNYPTHNQPANLPKLLDIALFTVITIIMTAVFYGFIFGTQV